MKAIQSTVIVQLTERKKSSDGGILLVNQDPKNVGIVIKIGSKIDDITEGDKILFNPELSTVINAEKHLYAVRKEGLICIL